MMLFCWMKSLFHPNYRKWSDASFHETVAVECLSGFEIIVDLDDAGFGRVDVDHAMFAAFGVIEPPHLIAVLVECLLVRGLDGMVTDAVLLTIDGEVVRIVRVRRLDAVCFAERIDLVHLLGERLLGGFRWLPAIAESHISRLLSYRPCLRPCHRCPR